MSKFDDLPDELRGHIFSYLRDKARDCCAMCNIVCVDGQSSQVKSSLCPLVP